MKQIVDKLQVLEKELSDKRGPFSLFALLLRDEAPGVWDLLVAAKWIDKDPVAARDEIATLVQKRLGKNIMKISHVALVRDNDPDIKAVVSVAGVEHGVREITDATWFNKDFRKGFVITARRSKAA